MPARIPTTGQTLFQFSGVAIVSVSINTIATSSEIVADDTTTSGNSTGNAVWALWNLDFAQLSTTAPVAGTVIRLESSPVASSDAAPLDYWRVLASITTGTTASVTTTTSGSTAGGSTSVITAGSATFGARTKDALFINDSTLANSEWRVALQHVTTTLTLADATTNTHATGTSMYDQAARYQQYVNLTGARRLRLRVDNNTQATGPTVAVRSGLLGWQA